MKNRLPRPRELAIFLTMAIVCTLVVAMTGKHDVALAVLGAPVFLVAALMGHRRSDILATAGKVTVGETADVAVAPPAAGDAAAS